MNVALLLCSLGICGLSAATLLFPAVGLLLWGKRRPAALPTGEFPKLLVLIPAHNEADTLKASIESLRAAQQTMPPEATVEILVAADACTDATESVARDSGARICSFTEPQGKWGMLFKLQEHYRSYDWVCLLDAGIVLDASLFTTLHTLHSEKNIAGLAPRYSNSDSASDDLQWSLERFSKDWESRSHSLISVHGACVFYRSELLREALSSLGQAPWLTEDVAIPLKILTLHPSLVIEYAQQFARDTSRTRPTSDLSHMLRRRQRLCFGNLRWLTELYPNLLLKNPRAAFLALRRVFRIFSGVWFAALILGFFALSPWWITLLSACAGLLVGAASATARDLACALLVSLIAPYYLVTRRYKERTPWN